MGHVVAISNVKGGVAKTSTASALGRSLSKTDQRVLLIDLDVQADLTTSVGITQGGIAYGSKDLFAPGLLEKVGINSFILPTVYKNLDILPSKSDMDWHSNIFPDDANISNVLKDLINASLRERYDFILIDCAPAANLQTLNALTAADLVIIPTQAEYFAANSLIKMMRITRRIRQETNDKLHYRVLVSMYAKRTRLQQTVMEEFRKGFGENLFETFIEIDTKIRESQSAHVPIIDYKPRSRGAIQYQNLADEVLEYFGKSGKTSRPMAAIGAQAEEPSHVFCPFLGFRNDIKTVMNYASDLNYCHRAKRQAVPKLEHQGSYCLTASYTACPMLRTRKQIDLPAELNENPPSLWDRLKF
jgi:chromosome partitioning protein